MKEETTAEPLDSAKEVEGKNIAIIAYITIIGLIIAFIMNNEKKAPFASYHIRQCVGLLVTGLALSFVNVIPILGWIVSIIGSLVMIYMWIIGLINAVNGKEKPLPILGEKYSQWFKGI